MACTSGVMSTFADPARNCAAAGIASFGIARSAVPRHSKRTRRRDIIDLRIFIILFSLLPGRIPEELATALFRKMGGDIKVYSCICFRREQKSSIVNQ